MRVGVDQAWNQRRAWQFDRAGTFRSLTSPDGPTASIVSPRTTTTQPFLGSGDTPSHTRAGLRTIGEAAAPRSALPTAAELALCVHVSGHESSYIKG